MDRWRLPLTDTAQHPGQLIHSPEQAQIPPQAFPDRLNDFWHRLFQGRCLGEHVGDSVLSGNTLFRAPAVGDVPDKGAEDIGISNFCRRDSKLNW